MYADLFPNELGAWQRRGATVLDVREPHEFAAGHIPGSINLPLGRLNEQAEQVPEPVVLVCASGGRSSTAAELLSLVGKTEVGHLMGGLAAYVRQGYTLERE
ncbi:MAG: rhodanese-like domain-containing protein [Meiothermus sp.]|nr:rhodanese-like domain-containing protein [Meiothermus sp.]